ncbi:Ankyrin-1 (ANK-1) (Ankyrin-R) (Erythrocyte ankyrin) [Durusdinium trenchii]|uniref:Ankyrin-1 (ANK-1) (Ankyrin-R) (Erythrocyte ankyrin) n=1 Tax=Durusdinium trenchii TaxID=1381693 RepID=A0ABP0J453_9DINO
MFRICSAVSGETLATLDADEIGGCEPVRMLKRRLAEKIGVPRFRQRWFLEEVELKDETQLEWSSCQEVYLVTLDFCDLYQDGRSLELISASQENRVERVEELLQLPLSPDADKVDWTALRAAARAGNVQCLTLLLEAGAEIEQKDVYGRTALHWAAFEGRLEVVELLLKAGAAVGWAKNDGADALHLAVWNGHLEVVRILLQARAEVDKGTNERATALHVAAQHGYLEISQMLLDVGADKNKARDCGQTALHGAAACGHLEVVRLLLEAGADIDAASSDGGATALHLASQNGFLEVVRLLLDFGADRHQRHQFGWTPLHEALASGHLDVGRLLLKDGRGTLMEKITFRLASLQHGFTLAARSCFGRTATDPTQQGP